MTFDRLLPKVFHPLQWPIFGHRMFAPIVLALSTLVTCLAWSISNSMLQRSIEERFNRHADEIARAIEHRLLAYETTLRGGAGLFKSTGKVTRGQWRTYVYNLGLQQALPGIQGIGFTQMLALSEVDSHIREVRESGFKAYTVHPPGKRDPTSSIVFLEPFDWRNQRAFGYDMYSEPARRAAMTQAMETGQPAMSGRVNLVQETDQAQQHGFLVYVPVYRSNMPITTTAERRAAIQGFVYSPFRVGDLMAGISGSQRKGIHFELYDGETESDAAFLYQSISTELLPIADEEPHLFNRKIPITVVGRPWLVSAHVTESYGKTGEITLPSIVAVVGLIVNLMLYLTITALQRQQRKLEQSNGTIAILSLAVEQNPHSIVITDLDGAVSYVNPAFLKTTGYTSEEIIGKNQRILQSGNTPESTYVELWKCLHKGECWQGRFMNRRKDGSDHIDQTIIAPIRSGPDDRITHYLAIKEDVSQQESTNQKLSETEQRLELALQATREVIWDLNVVTDQQVWNEVGIEVFGWEDIVSEPQPAAWWIERVHPDDRERLATEFHRILEGSSQNSWQDEYRFLRSDGTYANVLDRGQVLRDQNGKPVRMIGAMLDISELTRTRQLLEIHQAHLEHIVAERTAELKSSEQRIKMILAATVDGIIGTNRIGIINFANAAAENLLGYPTGGLITQSINETILHCQKFAFGDDKPSQSEVQCECDQSEVEDNFWRADGTVLPVEYSCRSIVERGEITGFVFGFSDISKRKAFDLAQQRAVTEAERLARIRGEFLSNMSHEIRTPLNAVIASAMLMKRDAEKPKELERLSRIVDSSQHLLRLISDILDFSKIEAGRIEIEANDFKLLSVIEMVTSQSVEIAAEKGIEWRTKIDPNLLTDFLGDSMRLGQILLNFSSNALKFTKRGSVTLVARAVDQAAGNLVVRFEVIDSGQGFEPSRRDSLFEAFVQEDSSTTREFGGTGLGLAISKKIAELMAGRIGAESKPGEGSTFWVEIPLKRSEKDIPREKLKAHLKGTPDSGTPPEPVRSPTKAVQMDGGQFKLLLAEDNPINQAVTLDMLDSFGLAADIANTGREAVTFAENRRYDLILMDMQMPVMGGLEATREIRRLPDYKTIPIIALTANAFEANRQDCLAVGMNDFLSKPVIPDTLYQTLHQWLGKPAANIPSNEVSVSSQTANELLQLTADSLPDIPGVNLRTGLAKMSGKRATFLKLLGQLIEMHGHDAETIRNKLAAGDMEGGRRVAHSLKGAAGMLGAEAVSETASWIDNGIRNGHSPDEIGSGLCELDRHFSAIRNALETIKC